jgi:hypothetical protein
MAEKDNGSLLTAILAVQGEVGTLPKDKINPGFKGAKYTPLDTIVEIVGPILNRHGLIWMTFPTGMGGELPSLRYVLQHAATGDKLEGVMPLTLTAQTPQGMGSALTYARRYSLCAVLNLVADDDDDANAGSPKQPSAGQLARAKANMDAEAKALAVDAEALGAQVPENVLNAATFKRYMDSTGYTADGLQKLVDWLRERVPKGSADA